MSNLTPKELTFNSSVKLTQNLIREMRLLVSRGLTSEAVIEETLSIASTLSDAIKKLSKTLDAPTTVNVKKPRPKSDIIDVKMITKIFSAMENGGDPYCQTCGKMRTA